MIGQHTQGLAHRRLDGADLPYLDEHDDQNEAYEPEYTHQYTDSTDAHDFNGSQSEEQHRIGRPDCFMTNLERSQIEIVSVKPNPWWKTDNHPGMFILSSIKQNPSFSMFKRTNFKILKPVTILFAGHSSCETFFSSYEARAHYC